MPSPSGTPTTESPRGAPRISLKPDERWFYVGRTGSGKSHLARANLRVMAAKRWRVCIIEPDGLWMGKTGKPPRSGPGTVDAPRLVERFDPKLAVQWFVPSPPRFIGEDDRLKQFLRDIMAAGDTVVYFDELSQLVDHAHQDPDFTVLWTQGRKHNIAAWAATQRPNRIPDSVMAQAENWGAFRVSKPEHAKIIADYMASPLLAPEPITRARLRMHRHEDQTEDGTALNQLPMRFWYYLHANTDYVMSSAQLMSPIPRDGWPGFERAQEAHSGQ